MRATVLAKRNKKKNNKTTKHTLLQSAATQHLEQDYMCAPRRLRSACAYAQSDQTFRKNFCSQGSSSELQISSLI